MGKVGPGLGPGAGTLPDSWLWCGGSALLWGRWGVLPMPETLELTSAPRLGFLVGCCTPR